MNAKYGKLSVRLFSKLHIMHMLHGTVCAAVVAPGKVNDPPHLRQMIEMLPEGDGNVPADAACGGVKNCNAINRGQRPEGDHRLQVQLGDQGTQRRGGDAILDSGRRFGEEHPGAPFHRILRLRNNVKERLLVHEGAVRRRRAPPQGEDPVG